MPSAQREPPLHGQRADVGAGELAIVRHARQDQPDVDVALSKLHELNGHEPEVHDHPRVAWARDAVPVGRVATAPESAA